MKTLLYKINTLTNLHAGSGDANYGVIDNVVQRDPTSDLPTVHGSSLKGALKEHALKKGLDKTKEIDHIFGSNDDNGRYRFLPAYLLAMPLRANMKMYYMATSPGVIKHFLEFIDYLGVQIDPGLKEDLEALAAETFNDNTPKVLSNPDGLIIEDFETFDDLDTPVQEITKKFFNLTEDNFVLFPDEQFKKVTDNNHLPVIARNQLENMKSKNLWYEQVVPRYSIFWTAIVVPEQDDKLESFKKIFKEIVHIGANATVGYGFTKFEQISQNKQS